MTDAEVIEGSRAVLDAVGVTGAALVRDLDSGAELGFGADDVFPVASLVKVPLAVAVLQRIARGEVDAAAPLLVEPRGVRTPG